MDAARLLAKAWCVFCLFAGAYALQRALAGGAPLISSLGPIAVCVLLFGAMGLLFAAGFGVSGNAASSLRERLKLDHLTPGFNGIVFVVFAVVIFAAQAGSLSALGPGSVLGALQSALHFAIPGQRALEDRLGVCAIDGGRAAVSALSWLLAFIFLGSALSRLRLAAAIVRLERRGRPEPLGASTIAVILAILSAIGIQLLVMGSLYALLPCGAVGGLLGQLVIGLGPLMLAYLVEAALTDLLALGPEA
ncbi:MAG TPA: hypothetical protein VIJ85_09600 [Rhizomicrobium sp.]